MKRRHRARILVVLLLLAAGTASAGQYPARSDTGWVHTGKRECCNDAIAQAQQNSAIVCQNMGGSPSPMRGGVQRRGSCAWESDVDYDGVTVFRCQSEAVIPCR